MAEQLTYSSRSGPRDRELRVSNDEREAVVAILRSEHIAGRLDSDEFDERLGHCLAAKTYAQLDELIADLPVAESARAHSPGRAWRRRPWILAFLPLIVLAIVLSNGHAGWLVVPFVFVFIVRPVVWGHGWRAAPWRNVDWRDDRRGT
jgi:hypothetical protein